MMTHTIIATRMYVRKFGVSRASQTIVNLESEQVWRDESTRREMLQNVSSVYCY